MPVRFVNLFDFCTSLKKNKLGKHHKFVVKFRVCITNFWWLGYEGVFSNMLLNLV